MLEAGQGIVFLHHAMSAWPAWPLWAQIVGGRWYERGDWSHPDGSGLVGWVKTAGRSPVAYLQPGHGPAAYVNPGFRKLLANAIRWVASEQASDWAADNATALR